MNSRLIGIRQRLENIEVKAKAQTDDEIKANLSQHLCVLTSGYVEEAVRALLQSVVDGQSSPRVARYVQSQLSGFQNPNSEKVKNLLGSFDPGWRAHFDDMSKTEMMSAIDSVVANRHQISHGRQVGISIVVFSRYFTQIKLFVEELDRLVA